jgi:hypothetical protein
MKNLIDAAIRNLSTNSSSTADYLHQITIYIHICHHHRPSFFNRLIAAISAAQVDLVYSGPVLWELPGVSKPTPFGTAGSGRSGRLFC